MCVIWNITYINVFNEILYTFTRMTEQRYDTFNYNVEYIGLDTTTLSVLGSLFNHAMFWHVCIKEMAFPYMILPNFILYCRC